MHYVLVIVGLAVLAGAHELVVRLARRALRRPWAVLLGIPALYLVLAIFAFALFAGFGSHGGQRTYVVTEALPGYDAAGKVLADDRILEVDSVAVSPTGTTVVSRVEASDGKPVVLAIERAGERRDVSVQPKPVEVRGVRRWVLGIKTRAVEDRVHDAGTAMKAALGYPITATRQLVGSLIDVFTGKEEADVAGPVRIVEELQRAADQETSERALQLLLLLGLYLSLGLAIFDVVRMVMLARQPPARSNV